MSGGESSSCAVCFQTCDIENTADPIFIPLCAHKINEYCRSAMFDNIDAGEECDGGTLRAENLTGEDGKVGGARFTVRLPCE